MGIRVTRTSTRQDINVEWYLTVPHRIPGLNQHVINTYYQSGMLLNRIDYSPDQLTQVQVIDFADQTAFDAYMADPVIQNMISDRTNYITAQNGALTFTEEVTNT